MRPSWSTKSAANPSSPRNDPHEHEDQKNYRAGFRRIDAAHAGGACPRGRSGRRSQTDRVQALLPRQVPAGHRCADHISGARRCDRRGRRARQRVPGGLARAGRFAANRQGCFHEVDRVLSRLCGPGRHSVQARRGGRVSPGTRGLRGADNQDSGGRDRRQHGSARCGTRAIQHRQCAFETDLQEVVVLRRRCGRGGRRRDGGRRRWRRRSALRARHHFGGGERQVSTHRLYLAVALLLAALVLSCDNNEAPQMNDGQIVLRFNPAAGPVNPAMRASVFDSVVVNVFRSGSTVRREVSHGVAIKDDNPITIPVSCVAENAERVGVDLYINRAVAYHGYKTNVNVVTGQTTAVTVDVSKFFITDLTLTPQIIPNGAAFTLRWPSAPAAESYVVEQSTTMDFAAIASWQSAADTTVDVHVAQGSHLS